MPAIPDWNRFFTVPRKGEREWGERKIHG